jgi:hypothetical protein
MNPPIEQWLRLVRAEYQEMPGLNLTKSQAQRLWNLDAETCEEVLTALETANFLMRTRGDGYVLARVDEPAARGSLYLR